MKNTIHPNGVTQLEAQMKTKKLSTKSNVTLSLLILMVMGLVGCGTLEVGALPADAASASNGDAGATEVRAARIRVVRARIEGVIRGQDVLLARRREEFAQERIARTVRVDVRGIDEVAASFRESVEDAAALLPRRSEAPFLSEGHRS